VGACAVCPPVQLSARVSPDFMNACRYLLRHRLVVAFSIIISPIKSRASALPDHQRPALSRSSFTGPVLESRNRADPRLGK
jgi:hypothetical protein